MRKPGEEDDFGLSLAILRMVLGWKQEQLAEAAGTWPSALSDYEKGKKAPRPPARRRLARAFGLAESEFQLLLAVPRLLRSVLQSHAALSLATLPAEVETWTTQAGKTVEGFLRLQLPLLAAQLADLVKEEARRDIPPTNEVPALWALLEPYRLEQQQAAIQELAELHSWPLCKLLCARSATLARDNADRAVELADLACRIAERLPGEEDLRSRRRGFAGCHLGNARRAQGNLTAAKADFAHALDLLRAGAATPLDLPDEARLLDLEASLRLADRELPRSLALLDHALELDPQGERVVRVLIKKAKVLEEMGASEAALATLHRAAPRIDAEGDPQLLFAHRHNRMVILADLGRHAEAEPLLPEVQALAARTGNDLDSVRLRWLEGRIAAGLGRREEGVRLLSEVREQLVQRKIAYDTGLVTLEIAALLAELGLTAEVQALARETEKIFKAQQVERERLGALRLFCQAAMKEKLTAGLARQLMVELRKARG